MTHLEKIARAINQKAVLVATDDIASVSGIRMDTWHEIARAAVEAMREPSDAIWEAGEATGEYGGISDHGSAEADNFDPREVWPAMIDAILNEKAE